MDWRALLAITTCLGLAGCTSTAQDSSSLAETSEQPRVGLVEPREEGQVAPPQADNATGAEISMPGPHAGPVAEPNQRGPFEKQIVFEDCWFYNAIFYNPQALDDAALPEGYYARSIAPGVSRGISQMGACAAIVIDNETVEKNVNLVITGIAVTVEPEYGRSMNDTDGSYITEFVTSSAKVAAAFSDVGFNAFVAEFTPLEIEGCQTVKGDVDYMFCWNSPIEGGQEIVAPLTRMHTERQGVHAWMDFVQNGTISQAAEAITALKGSLAELNPWGVPIIVASLHEFNAHGRFGFYGGQTI